MTLQDFDKEGNFNHYISKERFWFENKKVGFWYRIYLTSHTYQPDWGDDFWTRYQVLLLVDDESIHENHKSKKFIFPFQRGFFLKEVEKRGEYNEETMEKILNSALKLKIENKIKEEKYQKILGLVNGTSYYV